MHFIPNLGISVPKLSKAYRIKIKAFGHFSLIRMEIE